MPLPIRTKPSILWPAKFALIFSSGPRLYRSGAETPAAEADFCAGGHHFELADPEDPDSDLIISGIVYNEMKGAYSSPDNLMYKGHPGTPLPGNRLCE